MVVVQRRSVQLSTIVGVLSEWYLCMPADRNLPAFLNEEEELMSEIGGMDIQMLAKNHETPLIVYDEGALRDRLQSFTDHFKSDSLETDIVYASKAFNCKAIISLIYWRGPGNL